jgi:hypothetical protein
MGGNASPEKADKQTPEKADQERRLAEYAHLHTEKSQRATFQQALLALNLTVSGVVAGLVADKGQDLEVLLILSVTSPLFGLMWINQHVNIHRIAEYMQAELWNWQPSWEDWIRQERNRFPTRWTRVINGATYLSFAGVAFTALLLGWPFDGGSGKYAVPTFLLGVFVLIVFSLAFCLLALSTRDWRGTRIRAPDQ